MFVLEFLKLKNKMISSLPQQSGSTAAAASSSSAVTNAQNNNKTQKAFSCSSSGYSSQSLSECDTNSNKNKTPVDTLSSASSNSSPTSSQSASTNQIDKINPSVLLLESSVNNSLSCIRTSTPTNPINSTTLDNNNVYKSLSSECCYSDTLSSHYSSSNPSALPISQHHQQCSIDYYRQISFNPTCNSSSLCQSKNFYFVNNVKCYGESHTPYSLISPICSTNSSSSTSTNSSNLLTQQNTNKKSKYRSNPASFISTSTKTSIPVIKQEPLDRIARPHVISQPSSVVRQAPPIIKLETDKKPSRLTLVLTFIIKLLNCFNVFELFKSSRPTKSPPPPLSSQHSIENIFTSSTSLPLSSESTSSIPKILLKNKKNTTRTNDLACKLYAQSVLNESEKKQYSSGIDSPSSFNFVGFASNCVSSTPITNTTPPSNIVKSKEPVVKIKTSKMNIAAIESQLTSPYYTNYTNSNKNTNLTNSSAANIPIQYEKETYDNLPELDEKQQASFVNKNQVPSFPTNLVTASSPDEIEHYVRINTLTSKNENMNHDAQGESDANSTNYDNELEQIANQEIYSSSSGASSSCMSSSSSLVNSVNIYLSNLNKTSQTSNVSSSSASVGNSSSLSFTNKQLLNSSARKTVQFNRVKTSDFVIDETNQNYLHLNKQVSLRQASRGGGAAAAVPFYEDYLCDKEVESYFDNPNYFDCYKQKQQQHLKHHLQQQQLQMKLKQFNSNGALVSTSHQSFLVNNPHNRLVATKMRNCSFMINSTSSKGTSGFSVFKSQVSSNLAGMIRQSNQGESYC